MRNKTIIQPTHTYSSKEDALRRLESLRVPVAIEENRVKYDRIVWNVIHTKYKLERLARDAAEIEAVRDSVSDQLVRGRIYDVIRKTDSHEQLVYKSCCRTFTKGVPSLKKAIEYCETYPQKYELFNELLVMDNDSITEYVKENLELFGTSN